MCSGLLGKSWFVKMHKKPGRKIQKFVQNANTGRLNRRRPDKNI
jgi:hypothetical protein